MSSNFNYYIVIDRPYEGVQIVVCKTLNRLDREIALAKDLYGNESVVAVIEGQLSKLDLKKYNTNDSIPLGGTKRDVN